MCGGRAPSRRFSKECGATARLVDELAVRPRVFLEVEGVSVVRGAPTQDLCDGRHRRDGPTTRPGRGQVVSTTRPERESVMTARRRSASAKGDVGGHVAGNRVDGHFPTVGSDHDDPVGDGPDDDPPVILDGERVEGVGRRRDADPAMTHRERPPGRRHLAGTREVPRPEAPGVRLGDVHAPAVGREAHAVGPEQRKRHRLDAAAVRRDVVEAAAVDALVPALSVVREPQAPGLVEHEVVGAAERAARRIGGGGR